MYHLRKFSNNASYREYLEGDDQWLPVVAYVLNSHVEDIDPNTHKDKNMSLSDWSTTPEASTALHPNYLRGGGDNKRWVDFRDLHQKFIEVVNGGKMYFTDFMGTDKGDFYATVDSSGVLDIHFPTDSTPDTSTAWFTFDPSTGDLSFTNYPEGVD